MIYSDEYPRRRAWNIRNDIRKICQGVGCLCTKNDRSYKGDGFEAGKFLITDWRYFIKNARGSDARSRKCDGAISGQRAKRVEKLEKRKGQPAAGDIKNLAKTGDGKIQKRASPPFVGWTLYEKSRTAIIRKIYTVRHGNAPRGGTHSVLPGSWR